MAVLKLQHDRFQSAGAGSMRPRLYFGPLRLCSLYHVRHHRPVSAALTSSVIHVCVSIYVQNVESIQSSPSVRSIFVDIRTEGKNNNHDIIIIILP